MPKISNLFPLPGVPEIQELAQNFVNRLKDADFERDKRAALASQLQSLIECASELDNLPELTTQLGEIQKRFQKRFQETDGLRSRHGLRHVQHKLRIWDELKAKLDETIQVNMIKMMAQMCKRQAIQPEPSLREHKVRIIPDYEITDQVEILEASWLKSPYDLGLTPSGVKTTLRAGRFGNLTVAYKKFIVDSKTTARELVEKEIEHLSQRSHTNVATLVGATEGYRGLNGVIVVMDGIDLRDFVAKSHSGAVWVKYIKGFDAFAESNSRFINAERITVAPDGHVTIFPSAVTDGSPGKIRIGLATHKDLISDHAVRLILEVYKENYFPLRRTRVIKIAASCQLFPPTRYHYVGSSSVPLTAFQPEVGWFGHVSHYADLSANWESLGVNPHVRRTHQCESFWRSGEDWPKSSADQWFTYAFRNSRWNDIGGCASATVRSHRDSLRGQHSLRWEDILAGAEAVSQGLQVDLDSISFCHGIEFKVWLMRPKDASWKELPAILYYHWSPSSSAPHEVVGSFGATKIPDAGAREMQLKRQGWGMATSLGFDIYDIRDDWGRLYERELKRGMESMPGSFPGAYIEEVS